VFGIPFAILALFVWLVMLGLSGAVAAFYLGRLILGPQGTHALIIMLVGAGVLLVVYFIPVLGGVVTLVALWFGLGMLLLQVPRLPKPHYDVKAYIPARSGKK
jgi:hypothetical protein